MPESPTEAGDEQIARLAGRWLPLARAAWYAVAILVSATLIASIPNYVRLIGVVTEQEQSAGMLLGNPAFLSPSPAFEFWTDVVYGLLSFSASVLCLALAGVIYRKKPDELMAMVTSLTLLIFGVVMTGPVEMLVGQRLSGESVALFGQMLLWGFVLFLFYIFPDGRFLPGWTRWFSIFLVPWTIALAFWQPFQLDSKTLVPFMVLYTVPSLTAPIAQIYRYRRASSAVQRQQTKWVIFGFTTWILGGTVVTGIFMYLASLFFTPSNSAVTGWSEAFVFAGRMIWPLSLLVVPISLTIAILRYRLFNIDIIINRALVYGLLTAFVVAAYLLSVTGFSALSQSDGKLTPLLIATTVTVLLFRPLHSQLQQFANRVVQIPRQVGPRDQNISPGNDLRSKLENKPWHRLVQILWFATAMTALFMIGYSIPGYGKLINAAGMGSSIDANPGYVAALQTMSMLGSMVAAFIAFTLAVILFWRKRSESVALFVSWYLLLYSFIMAGPLEAFMLVVPGGTLNLAYQLQQLFMSTPSLLLFSLFPNGRFVPSWTRWLVLASCILFPAAIWLAPDVWISSRNLESVVVGTLSVVLVVSGVYAQIYRYRRVSSAIERQQTKWFVFGLVVTILLGILSSFGFIKLQNHPAGTLLPWWIPLGQFGWFLLLMIIPACLAIAVLRYHLWDVDILLNRTLVYGSLTALVAGLFLLVVTLLGAVFETSDNLAISLLATATIALLFQPLRERLQRGVNRMMYGERDEPYAVLSQLGKRMEAIIAPEAVLPAIAETVAQTLKLPYVAIAFQNGEREEIVAAHGREPAERTRLPLSYQGEPIGQMIVATRSQGEDFSPSEWRLLEDIAHQAGPAAYAVRVTADLQRSREKLVLAREEERRRLRRDLHDGLGATLAALNLQMGTLRNVIENNEPADTLMGEMRGEIHQAITDIRQLVYNLRPPALDELGLLPCLREQASRYERAGLRVRLEAPDQVPSLPAAVEVAVYRIVQEALANVAHHARAQNCSVSLQLNHEIRLEVVDDGVGISPEHKLGVGLLSMRERAAELGGTCIVESTGTGTRVQVNLPFGKE